MPGRSLAKIFTTDIEMCCSLLSDLQMKLGTLKLQSSKSVSSKGSPGRAGSEGLRVQFRVESDPKRLQRCKVHAEAMGVSLPVPRTLGDDA